MLNIIDEGIILEETSLSFEAKGVLNPACIKKDNVVFPTGAIIDKGRLYIYYGAADKLIASKSVELDELIKEVLSSKR